MYLRLKTPYLQILLQNEQRSLQQILEHDPRVAGALAYTESIVTRDRFDQPPIRVHKFYRVLAFWRLDDFDRYQLDGLRRIYTRPKEALQSPEFVGYLFTETTHATPTHDR